MTDVSLRYLLFGEDRTASKSMHGVGQEAEGLSSKVGGAFSKLGSVVGGEVGEILNKVGEGINSLGEHTKGLAPKMAVAAGALTGIGAALQMVGSHEKQAHDQLDQAFKNVGADAKDYRDQIEHTIKSQENFGHTAVETQQALQTLVQATRDPTEALKVMNTVADLAATKHLSLVEAAQKVAGVYNGNTKILKSFGITMDSQKLAMAALTSASHKHELAVTALTKAQQKLSDLEAIDATRKHLTVAQQIQLRNARDDVATATQMLKQTTDDLTAAEERNKKATHAAKDAVTQLGEATKGQAQKSVDNFAGRIDVVKTKIEDYAGKVAQFAGGPLTYLGTALGVVTGIMQVYSSWQARAAASQEAEAAATVQQSIAQRAAGVAAKGWAAAQWLLNAALDANPIAIVVIAVAALVAGLVLAYQHSQTFRDIVTAAFNAVGDAIGWVGDHWKIFFTVFMAALGPLGLGIALIVTHFSEFKSIARDAFRIVADAFLTVVGTIIDGAASAFGWMPGLGGKLKAAAKHFDAFRNDVNNALSGISDKTVHVNADLRISHAANAALHAAAPLTIGSARAAGGPVGPGSMYLVGERGPEVVTFGASGFVTPNSRSRQLMAGGDAGGIRVTIQAGVLTRDGAREIDKVLRQLSRETGGALGYA